MEDEIDLREYLHVLIRHWKLIVSITLIAVIAAVLVGFLAPLTYEAKASVLITETRAQIVFEPKYQTFSSVKQAELKQALVALVKSNSVAASVVEKLGDVLGPAEQNVIRIQNKVGVKTEGDLIEISVKSGDPEKAADIANAWAEAYVDYINRLYTGTSQSPDELRTQADDAKKGYEEKQRAWESFVSNNRLDELQRLIGDKKLLVDVKYLREQIAAGISTPASAAANSLAIILLQAKAFIKLPAELQVSLDTLPGLDASIEGQLRDIDALISTLESRTGEKRGQSVDELQKEILQLKGEHVQESARERELKRSRDVAWETYTTLDNKAIELEVASQAQDVAVRVAVAATVPELTTARPDITSVGIALVLGLIISVFAAFGLEYLSNGVKKPEVAEADTAAEEKQVDKEGT